MWTTLCYESGGDVAYCGLRIRTMMWICGREDHQKSGGMKTVVLTVQAMLIVV